MIIKFTEREKLVLALLAKGTENGEIGKALNISIHTVKVHITNLLQKLNAKNRTEIAFIAGKYGFVE